MSNISINQIQKSKDIEMIYRQEGYDTKKKLNRSAKKIPLTMLEEIEQGITSEQLDTFNVPIFKYGTQITVHGVFPDLEKAILVGGYKRIFQNKNKSVGVKYEAIDYDKKKRVYRAFRHEHQFRSEHNSREYSAYKAIRVKDRDEAMQKIEEYKPLFEKINLRFGSKQLYYAQVPYFGSVLHYMVFSVNIYAIYEKDIPEFFLATFGKTEAEIDTEIKAKEDKDTAESEARYEERERENAIRKEKEKALLDAEIQRLSTIGVRIVNNIPVSDGLSILRINASTDYTTKEQSLEYNIIHYYKPPRARLFKYNTRSFKTYAQAMESAAEKCTSYGDYKVHKESTSGIILKP